MPRSKEQVHKTMSAIRGKDTGIEKKLRKKIHEAGLHYQTNSNKAFGHPDLLFASARVAVFCDSEFWHGYHYEEAIEKVKTNREFWEKKIQRNKQRDEEVNQRLKEEGYLVLRYWGKEIEKEIDRVASEIIETVRRRLWMVERSKTLKELTTLAYIDRGDAYLMLFRNHKKQDENAGKWIGVGGHLEENESPTAAMKREIFEETGLTVGKYHYIGQADFLYGNRKSERMYLYTVTSFAGEVGECNEGELAWIPKKDFLSLPMWEGDLLFIPYLEKETAKTLHLLLYYDETGTLLDYIGPFFPKAKKLAQKRNKTR